MRILLGDFNEKTGEGTFSNQELGMTVYIHSNDNGVRTANFATSKIRLLRVQCSHTETFIN